MTGLLVAFAGVLGLAVGSFLNVVIWRVPRGESVVRPGSACPRCGTPIRARDNVPVLGWLVLRGRCRDCAAPISARYPLVELGTGLLFAVTAWRFAGEVWALPAYLYLAAIAVALAAIDLDVRRLPDPIVLPGYPVLAVLLAVASWGTGDWGALGRAGLGALALLAFYLLPGLLGGMGLGDVKLAGLLGAALGWLGWGPLVVGAFAAFVVGGLWAVGLLATRRAGRRSTVPFGPWMLLGAAIGIGAGEQVWTAYLGTF